MAKRPDSGDYKVTIIAVSYDDHGNRIERNWTDIPPEEQKEIGRRANERALRAAGYVPVPIEQAM